jgi:hypothetical protein
MADDARDLATRIEGTSVRRRSLLQVGAVTGALLATGLPSMALARDNHQDDRHDDDKEEHDGRGRRRAGRFAVTGSAAGGAALKGHLRVLRFSAVAGTPNQLLAHGIVSGRFRDSAGNVVAIVDRAAFTSVVRHVDDPACTILHLVLGPLTLNLLGLVLTIPNTITIDLTAIPGGGLLGDLLCVIDNLLLTLGGLGGILTTLTNLVTALNNFFNALNRI